LLLSEKPHLTTIPASFKVFTEEMTPEQRLACTHPTTRTSEGEFFGGASGSCQVEINVNCAVCGAFISSSLDYRN